MGGDNTLKSALNEALKNAAFNGLQIMMNGRILDFTIDITVDSVLFISSIRK